MDNCEILRFFVSWAETMEEWEHRLEITSYPVDQKILVMVRSTTPKNE